MKTIQQLRLDAFLSFAPESDAIELEPLNVLIGPNGAGKSNVIEALELLHATPTSFAAAIRDGGLPRDWLWKGSDQRAHAATIDVVLDEGTPTCRPMRYRLEFSAVGERVEVLDEAIEETVAQEGENDVYFYYRFQRGAPAINIKDAEGGTGFVHRRLQRETLLPDQSVLSQRKDPDQYPELTWVGEHFAAMQTFREWTFGRYTMLRQPQPADLPEDRLLPDALNLALVLNQIEHRDGRRLDGLLARFFPRYERMSTRVSGGTVQFYLHETGFRTPIPATRLSDGTIRFMAILALLLSPSPPPVLCIEEPELGLHPDAVALLADLLVEASSRMQLIVTTHSDALISELTNQPEAVVTCERPGEGTVLRRLDRGSLRGWLDDYRLGDLWRMGELGANP
jgi:predicted ATPase